MPDLFRVPLPLSPFNRQLRFSRILRTPSNLFHLAVRGRFIYIMFELEPIVVSDFSKAMEFWRTVLGTVGYAPQHNFAALQTFGKSAHCPNFSIVQASGGNITKGVIQLQVEDSEEVEEFYKKAIVTGARGVDEPDLVDGGRFMARFLDLDGNTVEVYCDEALHEL
jgi:predicted lactoylglutathione lyase